MNHLPLAATLSLLSLPLVSANAWALVSDRPDAAESSLTVPQYRFQVESGLNVTLVADFLTEVSAPTKLRFGLLDNLELHVETPIFSASFVNSDLADDEIGLANTDIGLKVNLYQGAEGFPLTVGALAAFTFPTSDQDDIYALRALMAMDYAFPQWVTLSLNLIYTATLNKNVEQDQTFGWATSLGFTGLADYDLSPYIEVFGNTGQRSARPVYGGAGVLYTFSESVQFDLYGRIGLKDANDYSQVGSGVSLLF